MHQQSPVLFGKLPDNIHDGIKHRVPARDEPRKVIEFTVASSNGVEVGGQHFPAGKHVAMVYETEVPEVERMVASASQLAAWQHAESVYEAEVQRWLVDAGGFTKADLADPSRAGDVKKARERYGGPSPAAIYSVGPNRLGLPPLRDFKVLRDAPAPDTEITKLRAHGDGLLRELVDLLRAERPKKGG